MCLDGELTVTDIPASSQRIFDVGTGTGIWVIEMGDKYEAAQVTGVDSRLSSSPGSYQT
jgi:methylase of polypeptide subunit release factors